MSRLPACVVGAAVLAPALLSAPVHAAPTGVAAGLAALRGRVAVVASSATTCVPAPSTVRHRAPGPAPRTVALTFDDGPGLATREILRILDANDVRATFFMLGVQVRRFPEVARSVVDAGHLVGNHTYDHASLRTTGRRADVREIRRTELLLADVGARPACTFRAPGGGTSPTLMRVAMERHLVVWGWSASSGDAEQPLGAGAVDRWVTRIVRGSTSSAAHPVVLLHDGRGDLRSGRQYPQASTVAALQRIITWYRSHGYEFVGLDGRG